jgi:predicted RecB family nuclease
MRLVDGTLVLSASDLTAFLECEHLTNLERAAAENGSPRPRREDPQLELLRRRGAEHEQAYLQRLRADGCALTEIPRRPEESVADLHELEALTLAAMRSGVDYVYQAAFFDGRWYGRADFLRRVETPSALGAWSYEVEDAKLARRLRVSALIQMADYSTHVARLQERDPELVHVLLGNNTFASRPLADVASYYRAARKRFEDALAASGRATYPNPVSHCRVCDWADVCTEKRRADDHLSLVAGARRSQVAALQEAGVATAGALARREEPVARLPEQTLERLRTQAALQLSARAGGPLSYRLLHPCPPHQGLSLLPSPSRGDLFFDMEGDGLVGDDGLEYLFGVLEVVEGAEVYTPFWGHDPAGERKAFQDFMDLVMSRLQTSPGLHIYHYAAYEPSRLKRLAGRYATREDDLDRLLRGKVFVDLYSVVRASLLASTESYSLKALEPLFMEAREERIRDAATSVVEYERWLLDGDPVRLQDIADYNAADCRSALRLRDWLESLRLEHARTYGALPERPEPGDLEPSEENAKITAETEGLAQRLREGVPDVAELRSDEDRARLLLAGLLDWHRREARPEWWEFFARVEMDDEQLRDDPYALSGLIPQGTAVPDGTAVLQQYMFDRTQESRLDVGDRWLDPATRKVAGEVAAIDRGAGVLTLSRTAAQQERGQPRALVPGRPYRDTEMRKALRRAGESVAEHGMQGAGAYRAARDLLLRWPPRVAGRADGVALRGPGESAVQAACEIALSLEGGYLPIQGPPGSGKTYVAAHIALSLTAAPGRRRRVGVAALSHRAISHLLHEICTEAAAKGQTVRIMQRAGPGQRCQDTAVQCVGDAEPVVAALEHDGVDIVAGTAWLFSREDMLNRLDTLIVDEASQVSLANVVAMSGAARNLILCGDPQQLNQPTRGTHPPGAARSSLEHVLDGAHTIAADRGLFLDVTRRMHPNLCDVVSEIFYDGRLRADASCANQAVQAPLQGLSGAGLRLVGVAHAGNAVRSPEEAEAVGTIVQVLLQGRWRNAQGRESPLRPEDLVVVAPYNAQVSLLSEALPRDVRVGTVDRFQGQQAAVSIYSLTASSAADQRRGMEFLYSLNRLDVALSRARAIAVLVCSPDLAYASCRTVDQLVLANALCRLLEKATPLRLPALQHELHFPGDLEVLAGVHDHHRG